MKIPLWSGDCIVAWALVDHKDGHLGRWHWRLPRSAEYPVRTERGKPGNVYMHREIMGLTPGDGKEVDHINRDKLDNRRENLRVVSRAQNVDNCGSKHERVNPAEKVSAFRGVSWHAQKGKWRSRYKGRSLGLFDDELEAAAAASVARRDR
jgi:HNH endonuclease